MKIPTLAILIAFTASCCVYGQSFSTKNEALRSPSNIVDYFLIAPFNTYRYPAYTAGSEYTDRIKVLTGARQQGTAVIDTGNAYLKVSYKDDDDIDNDITMTYFTCADSSKIIAVSSRYTFDNDTSYKHCFLRYRDGKFIDVTGKVLSGLSFRNFMKKGGSVTPRMDEYLMSTTAHFVLPRRGTALTVEMKSELPWLPDCDLEFPEDLYITTYKSRIYKSITMPFDRTRGIFTIGEAR